MFRFKCTIFREYNTPCLKPITKVKLLFTRFHSLQYARLLMSIVYDMYNCTTGTVR